MCYIIIIHWFVVLSICRNGSVCVIYIKKLLAKTCIKCPDILSSVSNTCKQ